MEKMKKKDLIILAVALPVAASMFLFRALDGFSNESAGF